MRRAPLFLLLLLAACSSAGAVSLVEPPEISTPILTEPVPTTEVVTETPEEIEVLHDRVTATTTPETTTTVAPTPVKKTTTGSPTTTAPAPSPTTTTIETPGGGYAADLEAAFASKINGLRSSVGVAGLSRNGDLDAYARSWARQMGESGNLGHSNFASLLGPWSTLGENVAYGSSVSSIFAALSGSSGHYANMVEPSFTNVGIGVWVAPDGTIWTCHIFAG